MKSFFKERLFFFNKFISSRFKSPLSKVVFITLFSSLITFLLNLFPIFEKLEMLSLDVRYKIRPDIKKSDDIVLVNFDDASLNLYGQWPWSRFYQTLLVDTLSYYKVRAIGYDVFFSEEEKAILKPTENNKSLVLRKNDEDFQRAISQSGVVYLAYSSRDPHKGLSKSEITSQVAQLKSQFSEDKKKSLALMETSLLKAPKELEPFLYKSIDIDPPIYRLLNAARGFGFAQPGYSKDAIMRNFILFRYYDGLLLNPITLVMFSDWADFHTDTAEIKAGQYVTLKGVKSRGEGSRKEVVIPVDNHLQALLNWPGTFDSAFIHISFRDIVYLYALNQSMKIISKSKTSSVMANTKTIIKELSIDFLLPLKEIEQLALKTSLIKNISESLKKGIKEEKIIYNLKNLFPINGLEDLIYETKTIMMMTSFLGKNKDGSWNEFAQFYKVPSSRQIETEKLFSEYEKTLKNYPEILINPYIITAKIPAKVNGKETSLSPFALKDKLVLVGLTGKNTIDLNPTPYEKDCPMVFYHASGLNMMLTGQFLKYPPRGFSEAMIVITTLCIAFVGVYRSVGLLTVFSLVITLIFTLVTYKMWTDRGQWIEFVPVITAMTITYITSLLVQFIRVYREKSKIRAIFASMVSPSVLTVMENNPDKFALTGERRFATTYFSKIDAIDTIASSFSAEQLPAFLSTYLTPMSDVIIEYNGYIDKYEGAVIMADFGVPLDDKDNPIKCAFASLEQRFFIESFKFAINKRYSITPSVSIGFNSGYVSAGNMGSDRKFQYTVMGDPVNMAARLMAANSIYDSTYAITSLETINLIKDYVYARPLDKILLKGKTVPTMIYDILGWRKEAYREIIKDKSLPSFIHSIWTHGQVETIFYQNEFWSRQFKRLDNKLAQDIADFFKSCEDIAKEIIALEINLEAIRIRELIEKRLDFNPLPDTIESLLNFFDELTVKQISNDEILSLKNRAKLLLSRQKNAHMIGIDTTLLAKDIKSIESLINNKYELYHSRCKNFIKTIKPQDYVALMSSVGEPEDKELITTFEEGLNAYWRRDWQEASEIFKNALSKRPDDNPLKAMVQRIEEYKTSPPDSNWQGEYIQTKK
ncbi:MAG: CHASE2 domain-containing protein [Thermodesulfovibrionales bacterium]|nr:CHASE2 domain-containing protein [Thermodesulfovibrionales bacterium]